ncbi:NADP-dependent oxidoreductase [Neisseria sp. Ec49-e6-T10]|uniref:NADP-dependent oxidoreductase n=1 Tax=Neisseria sp. Ec49-e6-T10 TaxID=3140744 RepID=UPI003EBC0334
MKGIGIYEYGNESKLVSVNIATPTLQDNEVLIDIKASGVNPVDWKIREGWLQDALPYQLPLILGWDAAGIIKAVGQNVTEFKVGDDVFFRPEIEKQGTYADEIVVPAQFVAHMPQDISYVEAAALPLVGLTVWQALVEVGKIKANDEVLILAGSGGIGSTAIQIAKALGAHVTTTTSTKNIDYVRKLGADHVIAYDQESIRATSKHFDFMLDTLGSEAYEEALEKMKPNSIIATIFGSPTHKRADRVCAKEQALNLTIEYVFTRPDGQNLEKLKQLVEQKKLIPHVSEVYPMTVEGVREAHLSNQTGRTKGKIVLQQS